MTTIPITYGRLPNEIIDAHKNAGIKLSPICCDAIEKYKQQLDGALRQRPSTTLKDMSETIGESKKDFYISSGKIKLMNSQLKRGKINKFGLGQDRFYKLNNQEDIIFLGNNKYKISIPGKKYGLPGILNNPDLNITLEYHPKNGSINYYAPGESKGTIILNKTSIVNLLTVYQDKVAKTKVIFRAQNKDFELIIDIPFQTNSVNNSNFNKDKIAA